MTIQGPSAEITQTSGTHATWSVGSRGMLLFVNFFLIITAYYQLKPASRSLFIEYLGADRLPYAWIATAVILLSLIGVYSRLVRRYSPFRVVLGSCALFIVTLLGFRVLMSQPGPLLTGAFYVFTDILSVVLVEQFWSLANSLYSTNDAKRWYGMLGTGGLLGGVAGAGLASLLVSRTALETPDLLLVAAAILAITMLLTTYMGNRSLYSGGVEIAGRSTVGAGWEALRGSHYLLLVAGILLLAQLASPVVEYQFLHTVEHNYPQQEARTAFIAGFFGLLGLVSIGVNLVLTPWVHRRLGVVAGLVVQPLITGLTSYVFMFHASLYTGAAMKIGDRGLSHSINRASRELLYVPIEPVLIYQAKAWIDMVGYRVFKLFGAVLILLLTQWLPLGVSVTQLGWVTISICLLWLGTLAYLYLDYRWLEGRTAAWQPEGS